jgi:hypothetical protein
MCRTEAARDRLAERAADPKLSGLERCSALVALGRLRDNRFLKIATAPGFFYTANNSGWIIQGDLAELTGHRALGMMRTDSEAREYVEEHGVRFDHPHVKISVAGGIDWSTVKWN